MKTLLTSSAIALLAASAALAGGPVPVQPAPEPAPPAPVVADWSGFYAGGLGGFQTGDAILNPGTPGALTFLAQPTTYGGFAGFNFQDGNLIYGAEVALQTGNARIGGIAVDFDFIADVRARFGYAFEDVMVYAAGGVTYEQVTALGATVNPTGFNLGAGLELNVTDDFFIGGEYVYRNVSARWLGTPVDLNTHAVQVRAGIRF